MKDYLVKAYAFGGTVRIYAANTTGLVDHAQKIHDLWPTSAAALGRLLTGGVIMGAMYKKEDELTIRVQGDGSIGGMVATTNAHGEVRGYVSNPHVFLQYSSGKLNVGQAVGNGQIHVTKDLKVRNMFTSSSEIQTGEIAEDLAYYFTVSEQASGGFILQIMPGCKEETIQLIEERLSQIKPVSQMIEEGLTPEKIIEEITQGDHQFLEELSLKYVCNCSREKFEKGLISLGEEQLKDILHEDGQIETNCHFCNTNYHFDSAQIESLIKETK